MIYTAINIGPIYATMSMARKPREFWQASYMFSHLMKCILETLPSKAIVMSPCIPDNSACEVGLFPDRTFFKTEQPVDVDAILDAGMDKFFQDIRLPKEVIKDYFNVMAISLDCQSDRQAIALLNERLNFLELTNYAPSEETSEKIRALLMMTYDSPLYKIAFGQKKFNIETLESIATYELRHFNVQRKSYHDYICIVQADGDNMGNVVSHLPDNHLHDISEQLMQFGQKACGLISKFGGLPIYAGGDDLLFIAPVWGGENVPQNIYALLNDLDSAYKTVANKVKELNLTDENGNTIQTTMSYGLSVTYYKYPLYEAWKLAGEALFLQAKQNYSKNKNAICWKILKHAGSTYEAGFTKSNSALCDAFTNLLHTVTSDSIVSAVAHKIRSNESLLALLQHSPQREKRLRAFFDKVIDVADKDEEGIGYMDVAYQLMVQLYDALEQGEIQDVSSLVSTAYSMLRTAKFINGEEDKQ